MYFLQNFKQTVVLRKHNIFCEFLQREKMGGNNKEKKVNVVVPVIFQPKQIRKFAQVAQRCDIEDAKYQTNLKKAKISHENHQIFVSTGKKSTKTSF